MAKTKTELRKVMANVVCSMTIKERQRQSEIIFAKMIEHSKYKSSKIISIYLSTNKEVDTEPILRHALEVSNKRCFIPVIKHMSNNSFKQVPTRMLMVELNSMKEFDNLPINLYGIKEPKLSDVHSSKIADPVSGPKLDLALLPGVAFSIDGGRLGHGKGYYDEYLSEWKRHSEFGALYSIGLAFKEQIVKDSLAVDGQDYKLDEVLTGCQS